MGDTFLLQPVYEPMRRRRLISMQLGGRSYDRRCQIDWSNKHADDIGVSSLRR